jgi:hypothetical protein
MAGVRQDGLLTRLTDISIDRAIDEDRSEYGLRDLLQAIAADPEATAVAESVGLDLRSLHQYEKPDAPGATAE